MAKKQKKVNNLHLFQRFKVMYPMIALFVTVDDSFRGHVRPVKHVKQQTFFNTRHSIYTMKQQMSNSHQN